MVMFNKLFLTFFSLDYLIKIVSEFLTFHQITFINR